MENREQSQFCLRVYRATRKIPRGKVATYAQIARAIGHPRACRAVGNILNKNKNTKNIPCHRVVRSDGTPGGYAFGFRRKIEILKREGVKIRNRKALT
ncbi:MAG: MGMT family protein [Candidatus Liptonbacteria bacterium]